MGIMALKQPQMLKQAIVNHPAFGMFLRERFRGWNLSVAAKRLSAAAQHFLSYLVSINQFRTTTNSFKFSNVSKLSTVVELGSDRCA